MDHLHAGWRLVLGPGLGSDGRPIAEVTPADGQTLFEAIEQSGRPDEETYILVRRARTFAILNVFPYTSGHVMVLPRRAATTLDELDDETYHELWSTVREASRAVTAALRPEGLNIGFNQGSAGGGSYPDHVHIHVVPRWDADTNFMTTLANVRVLPVTLADTWARLREHWPAGG